MYVLMYDVGVLNALYPPHPPLLLCPSLVFFLSSALITSAVSFGLVVCVLDLDCVFSLAYILVVNVFVAFLCVSMRYSFSTTAAAAAPLTGCLLLLRCVETFNTYTNHHIGLRMLDVYDVWCFANIISTVLRLACPALLCCFSFLCTGCFKLVLIILCR